MLHINDILTKSISWTKERAPSLGYYYIYDTDFENDVSIAKLSPDLELTAEEYRSVMPVPIPPPPNQKDIVSIQ